MKPHVFCCSFLVCASVCIALSVRAGSFSTDFNSGTATTNGVVVPLSSAMTLLGNAVVDSTGGPDGSGCLKLTAATTSQSGGFVLPDLDNGNRLQMFTATFNVHMGNGTANPADGFSFNLGVAPTTATFGEQGIINGAGLNGISVGFDAFDNGSGDDQEAPEICVRFFPVGGSSQLIARRKLSNQLKTGAGYVPVMIRMNNAGTLDVYLNNTALFTNLFITGTGASAWQFSMCARTGGAYQEHWIDDLNITTVPQINTRRYVKTSAQGLAPNSLGNTTASLFRIPFQDGSFPIDTNATTLFFNGVQVPINWQYNSNGGGAIISQPNVVYDPKGLAPGSVNTAKLIVVDNSGQPPDTYYWTWSITNAPLWTIAPGSRTWLGSAEANVPTVRSIAYSPVSNVLYVASRFGGGNIVQALDPNTGADLYKLNTTGIAGGSSGITLNSIAVADDGAVFACNVAAGGATNFNVYKWPTPDTTTPPTVVYSAVLSSARFGDSLAVRGSDINTLLLADGQNNPVATLFVVDSSGVTLFPYAVDHGYSGTVIGRGIGFGPTNTFYIKKKPASGSTAGLPLDLFTAYNSVPGDQLFPTVLSSVPDYHWEVGAMTVDFTNNIGAAISFSTNAASYDRLYIYDLSNLASPLQIATYNNNLSGNGAAQQCYNFPVTHVSNANFIGQVVMGANKIFAIDANNGIIAVPEFQTPTAITAPPPPPQKMTVVSSNGSVIISWPVTGAGEVLQSNPTLAAGNWSNVGATVIANNGTNSVTITPNGANYYRLAK